MKFSLLISKSKTLFPVFFIFGVATITVKLLTTETSHSYEIFKVNSEEDIKIENYEDQIEEPQIKEEKKLEEEPSQKEVETVPPEENKEEEESKGESQGDTEKEEKKEEKEKEEKPSSNRKFVSTPIGKILGNLIKPKKG